MLHSSFADTHCGRQFTIRFYGHPKGYTAGLEIEGLPASSVADDFWVSREEAKMAMIRLAHHLIESQGR